ncbi:MAG TPA: precorrin-3B synthase [Xanthobacteraceae bacterium]|jgi:precorrin-3B synthase|nr:precorrin-3B synthase [Xanthobacteraceae bacterium]
MNAPTRRGACPGVSAPMQTGDGLLARLMPTATIALEPMAGLCRAAERHGNGIIEITARGSIQVRGLDAASAAPFADAVARLGIAAHDGVPVIADPLAGLDPDEVIDAAALAAGMRAALAASAFAGRLSPKVSVALDGGGALHLDALGADVRLRAEASDGVRLYVAIGGDAATAVALGAVAPTRVVETVVRLLDLIAAHGRDARARDILRREGVGAFRAAAGDRWIAAPPPASRPAAEPIGIHMLRAGCVAVGVGVAFGHADATTLQRLLDAATAAGAQGVRAAPGRALLVVGLRPTAVAQLVTAAENLGFITHPDDPRRRVVACAGAPICASGEIPARTLASQVAQAAAGLIGAGEVIHISGCPKGCAHRGAAALAAIGRAGRCDLLIDDVPAGSVAADAVPRDLARLARQRSVSHG